MHGLMFRRQLPRKPFLILYRQFADFRNGERADGGAEIQAELKGAATLDGEWKWKAVEGASAAEKVAMRFFKVVVEVQ